MSQWYKDARLWNVVSAVRHCGTAARGEQQRLLQYIGQATRGNGCVGTANGLSSGLTGLATQGALRCSTQAAAE